MTTFANQSIGSFDKVPHGEATHEYVEVWYDETKVKGFSFHSVMMRDVLGRSHRVFGMSVDARHVFEAMHAFSGEPSKAVPADGFNSGISFYVTRVWIGHDVEEIRMGDKWGKPVARMRRTGYVQAAA